MQSFYIWDSLSDLVPFVQFKKREKPMEECNFKLSCRPKLATLLKVALLHEYFLRFLNCKNGTKSRKVPHLNFSQERIASESEVCILMKYCSVKNPWIQGFLLLIYLRNRFENFGTFCIELLYVALIYKYIVVYGSSCSNIFWGNSFLLPLYTMMETPNLIKVISVL